MCLPVLLLKINESFMHDLQFRLCTMWRLPIANTLGGVVLLAKKYSINITMSCETEEEVLT